MTLGNLEVNTLLLMLFVYYNMAFVRDILNILAQCNKPKPSPTCTSCLGFSRLYILMLGFIVTHVIILHLHNKDVGLKGFLCGCRPTRLNHVTLIFSVYNTSC